MIRPTVVAAVAALILGACSSTMSLDEYTETMSATAEAYVVESQNLSFDYQSAVEDGVRAIVEAGDEDAAEQATELMRRSTVEYLALLLDAMGRYVDDLDALGAPSAISEAHEDYVDAVSSVHRAIPATQNAVRAAEDLVAIERAFSGSAFADAQPRWTATCASLESAIREAGGAINLRCVRTEPTP